MSDPAVAEALARQASSADKQGNDKNTMANQNFNQEKEIEKKVAAYVGPEGLATKQLEYGLWYVEHKRQLKMILNGFLILISAVSWVYTIYGFAYYIARGMGEDEILTKQLAQANSVGHDYILQVSAKALTIEPVQVLRSSGKKYDIFASLKNDNPKWMAEFDYYFMAAGLTTEKTRGYILPMETKYLSALARDFANAPEAGRLILENISWQRINQHKIPDWNGYYTSHLNILTNDIKFIPANLNQLSEKLSLNQLSFNAINQTAYNYWEVGFTILLYNFDQAVGINHYILQDFMSGQKRPVAISWPGDLDQVGRVEIIPEINIMKDDIYIPFEGGTGQEK